ncbi:MAG TPA: PHB depolymerase family esterase [Kofleriaceae bacterium]|nr:PHB depolymerase family esterase [Kofleriaceae bacterium]
MRHWLWIGLFVTGCAADSMTEPGAGDDSSGGDDSTGEPGSGDDDQGTPATIAFACPAGTPAFVQGLNTFSVNGQQRSFFADFPADMTKPLGVVFSWHGFAQEAVDFRAQVALHADADPEHPVVIITPNDQGLLPPFGLDWNIVKGTNNADLAMFEATLGCLNAQQTIDADAIYSFGFSAGSVMTSLVHASYPNLVRTIVAESGAWFDDPAEVALVTVPMPWDWPALPTTTGTASVLLTHGGPTDVTVANILSLENAAQAAFPFLAHNWRVVVDCAHDQGHALAPDVTPDLIVRFLTSHHGSAASSQQIALPASCSVRMP